VNIRFLRCGGWRFRPYGDSLFLQTPGACQRICRFTAVLGVYYALVSGRSGFR
jgi:hypothetical protein